MNKLIFILLLCTTTLIQAEPRYKTPEPPTAQQLNLVCRYQSQLARGLLWTISVVGKATQSVPPYEFMAKSLMDFYDKDKNEDMIAMAQAATVLNWIYKHKPDDYHTVEGIYFSECMGEISPETYWHGETQEDEVDIEDFI